MIKLGVNSLLFKKFDFVTAAKSVANCGYDGISLNAIKNNGEHLDLFRWERQFEEIQQITSWYGLELLAMEVAHLDGLYLMPAFEACARYRIPIVNVGPGGKTGVEDDLKRAIEQLAHWSEKASVYGVTLCVKAHAGHAIYNSDTLLRALREIDSAGFGVDFDPSHFYRANEDPVEVLPRLLDRVKHVHIRDCKDRNQAGTIFDQCCGRGNIDLVALCRGLVEGGYAGPINLEIIGSDGYPLIDLVTVANDSYKFLRNCLKKQPLPSSFVRPL